LVGVLLLAGQGEAAPPGRRRAMQANTLGMHRYQEGQLARAAEQFRDALASDPEYAIAHYNLACVASRLRDVKTAIRELGWLERSKDPVAVKKLAKAAVDPDLDFISVLPEARRMLGLPPFDAGAWRDWLVERDGLWSAERGDAECERRSILLRFAADGSVGARVDEACRAGQPTKVSAFAGMLDSEPRLSMSWTDAPKELAIKLAACPGLEAPGSCFTLEDGEHVLGPFHRGLPGTSPLKLASR